jgi:hypothetical protein
MPVKWEGKQDPSDAAEQFQRQSRRHDGPKVIASLEKGFNLLRDLFYERMHFDVEQNLGADSMLIPLSETRTHRRTQQEIDIYQVVESAALVHQAGYLGPNDDWYVGWLGSQRLGAAMSDDRIAGKFRDYAPQTPEQRRRAFMDRLQEVLPESSRAPLVLFSLVPLAVQLATALAFADAQRAADLRRQQLNLLPAIADCRACRGQVRENGELCLECGNPLWKFKWLTST